MWLERSRRIIRQPQCLRAFLSFHGKSKSHRPRSPVQRSAIVDAFSVQITERFSLRYRLSLVCDSLHEGAEDAFSLKPRSHKMQQSAFSMFHHHREYEGRLRFCFTEYTWWLSRVVSHLRGRFWATSIIPSYCRNVSSISFGPSYVSVVWLPLIYETDQNIPIICGTLHAIAI
jgi:hypothetical protein